MKYLLDTNVVSEPIKAHPAPGVLARIAVHAADLALSAVSWHELLFGLHRKNPATMTGTRFRPRCTANSDPIRMLQICAWTRAPCLPAKAPLE